MTTKPRFWITYAWADNKSGDFSYLVQELKSVGVEAVYDRVTLIAGRDLWAQIGDQIVNGPLDGWGYLVTPNSLSSNACREELAYALSRALSAKGRNFPIVGLLSGVKFEDLPPPLRVRLCVSLANPNWKKEVKSGLQNRPPQVPEPSQSRFTWQIHQNYGGVLQSIAIEIRPRFEEVMYWRFVVPASGSIVQWGHGPANGGAIANLHTQVVEGTINLNGINAKFFGAGDKLSPGISAYVVFSGILPAFVGFGLVSEPFGIPGVVEVWQLA